jgi:hypothetical protein
MSYDAHVYRILIASPSDVEEERDTVASLIQSWNDLYSYVRKVVLLPLRWETHTAPEYGTRPQEVINRAIVDECDLLVGIFWTRVGSPTGIADSGTLEEIERVGKAGKPIMLYFSRVEIDPERIDTSQIERLKGFRTATYPRGLTETYRSRSEFRDKFSRQLEMKIRDLQQTDSTGTLPLALTFLSAEDGKPVGSELRIAVKKSQISDLGEVPPEMLDRVRILVAQKIEADMFRPVIIGLDNRGSAGIRNLYVQLEFSSNNSRLKLSEFAPRQPGELSSMFTTEVDPIGWTGIGVT